MTIRNLGSLISDEIRTSFITQWMARLPNELCVLDVGCGKRPYSPLYTPKARHVVGVDVPYSQIAEQNLESYADAQHLPFRRESFDLILCTEVLEHVPEPAQALSEMERVITPQGHIILTTPFLVPEHDIPYDFYRYTRYGLRHLLEQQGFHILMIAEKGDLLGVSVAAVVRYQLKFWHIISKITHLPFWATARNPFVWLGVWCLQRVYLGYFGAAVQKPGSLWGKIHQVFRYGCLGFVVLASRRGEQT